jgi:hypothetical protein
MTDLTSRVAGDTTHTDDPAWRRLRAAALVFGVGSAVHVLDHLRRGQGSVTDELLWAGNLALVFQVVVVTLVLARHRTAPLWAAAVGPALTVGFATAHWLPEWSPLSDPVWQVDSLPWLTAVASLAEVVGALAVAVTGIAIVRRDGLASFGTPRPA